MGITRAAPKPFSVTIPANHPALFSLGGRAFYEAASDLVDRVRKAAAMASIEDPAIRALMERYHAALSTAWGPGELLNELRARGVTDLHGTELGIRGKPLSALLRECADEIDRAEASRRQQPSKGIGAASMNVPAATRAGQTAKKTKTASPEEMRRQPGLKLPIKAGRFRASERPNSLTKRPTRGRSWHGKKLEADYERALIARAALRASVSPIGGLVAPKTPRQVARAFLRWKARQ